MRKGLRIFLIALAVLLIAVGGSLWHQYAYQRDYQSALENSNFLRWSHTISAEEMEYAVIRRGYGANTTKYVLSPEELEEACQILNHLPVEEFSLTNDGKNYFILTDQDADINFYINDGTDEFEFRYRPSNPGELYIRSNSEMGDSFQDLGNRWTTHEALIDFMLSHAPAN